MTAPGSAHCGSRGDALRRRCESESRQDPRTDQVGRDIKEHVASAADPLRKLGVSGFGVSHRLLMTAFGRKRKVRFARYNRRMGRSAVSGTHLGWGSLDPRG